MSQCDFMEGYVHQDEGIPINIKNECLIDGKVQGYDACSESTLADAIEYYYPRYKYIGTGTIFSIHGKLQNSKIIKHFFNRK